MKSEEELKDMKKKLEFILNDEFLAKEMLISPSQKQRLRIKIGMIDAILNEEIKK